MCRVKVLVAVLFLGLAFSRIFFEELFRFGPASQFGVGCKMQAKLRFLISIFDFMLLYMLKLVL